MHKLLSLLLVLFVTSAYAEVRLPRVFTDHAVFQRQKPIPVWGWAKPGEKVTVELAQQKVTVKADKQGRWKAQLPALEAGGPFTLKAASKSNVVELKDILIGEVWICSGQSNMEFQVNSVRDAIMEKGSADYPRIRQFTVEKRVEFEPQEDLRQGEWVVCNPRTAGNFTAVGYFFAREIFLKTGIPVGLIHSSWGGSQVEGWISREGYERSSALQEILATMPRNWQEADSLLDVKLKKMLLGTGNPVLTPQSEEKYSQPGYEFPGWKSGYAPGAWDWQGIWAFRGEGYAMTEVLVPKELTAQETMLGLGYNDSETTVWLNGKLFWKGTETVKHQFSVPAGTWKEGKNIILMKYGVVKNPDWFGIGLAGPAGDLYLKSIDLSLTIPLSGNIWKMMPSFAGKHTYAHLMNNVGITLYNAMIRPLVPYGIRGVLWYQGEANTGRAYQYRTTFPDLINDWRQKWGEIFPFYFVQLSGYGPNQSSNEGSDWAELREAQTLTLRLPQTGMAVTTDIGDASDIHPTNKQDVGKRLAAIALNQLYGVKVPYLNPMVQSFKTDGNKAVVTFLNAENGLSARDKFGYVRGFELAGADKKWFYAQAQIKNGTIVVSCPEVRVPVAVRYAWSNAPVDANVFSNEGLPLCPFRTDDWPGITVRNKFE